MRKLITLIVAVMLTASVFAQSPNKMSYQAVIRNSANALVTNTQVGMRISIQKFIYGLPPTYQDVYVETHNLLANANGLVSLQVGGGAVVSGTFSAIDWANGEYYIRTETDPAGGTNYTITARQQLLSVPYALHATTAGTALSIGQAYQGGIIFWLDATGQHGLIAATVDQSTGIQWYNETSRNTGTLSDGLYAGAMNTAMIIATQMADNQTGNFAAKVCADYSATVGGVTYGDWYLPSKYELNLLYSQKNAVGGFASAYYWSSSEVSLNFAWTQYFVTGTQPTNYKGNTNYVRAVRAF